MYKTAELSFLKLVMKLQRRFNQEDHLIPALGQQAQQQNHKNMLFVRAEHFPTYQRDNIICQFLPKPLQITVEK